MMDVVITSVIGCDVLQGIKWQSIAAMVIDCLDRRAREKPHPLAGAQSGELEGY